MSSKKENWLLLTLALLQFTNIVDFMIIMPLGKMLMRTLSINTQAFGLIVSSYTFSAGISGFLAMFYIDWFDRKAVLKIIYSGFILGTLLCGLANSYEMLLAARILTGAFGGVLGALSLSIVSDVIPLERRAAAMGKVMAAFSAASVLGVPLGIFLANYWNWHFPFFFLAALGLPVWLLIFKHVPSLTDHLTKERSNPIQTLQGIFEVKNHWKALFFGFILMLGHFSIIPFISPYMVSNVGFTEKQLTWIYFVGGLLTLFTSPLVGKLADKYGRFRMYAIFAASCCFPIFLITNLGPTPIWQALIVSGLFFIATGGRMVPMQAMVSAAVNPKIRGSFMTLNASVQQLTAGLASLIASRIITENKVDGHVYLVHYDLVGYGAIVFSLLGIWVASQLKTVPQTIPHPV